MPTTPTKIFGKEHLKVAPELQDEIIRRYNSYDLLIRVMKLTAENLNDLARSSKLNDTDAADIRYLSARLKNATAQDWQKVFPVSRI